jgi:serine/threonine protein kinase/tetratricopeptide (TPR) repeat protein
MTPQQWAKVKEIVAAALDIPRAERRMFVERACGQDTVVFNEAMSLLNVEVTDADQLDALPTAGTPVMSAVSAGEGFTPGTILASRYRIVAPLGRGGMGEVYRADDLKLGQTVALKFLPRMFSSDSKLSERFFKEVRITRQLSHPNICRVYDIAEFEGQHFLSMEYIDGEDLASLIKRIGYLSNEKALEITRQLLAALSAAHERGVLHRDLKPANIMLDGQGRVRIMDFGIAVSRAEETQTGDLCGTPAYMAPEQLEGVPASEQSDIYALGLVLYEIYSGKKAFGASSPAPLSTVRPAMDPVAERLIMQCLQRDPRLRPPSVAHLSAVIGLGQTPSAELVAVPSDFRNPTPQVVVSQTPPPNREVNAREVNAVGNDRVKRPWLRYTVFAGGLAVIALAAALLVRNSRHEPKLTNQDVLVVADFDNQTGDPVFDSALRQALAFQLEQSPFLKAMDEAQVREAVKLGGHPEDTRVTRQIAREACVRNNVKATLEGTIASIGSAYLLSLQAVNCETGATLAREQTQAGGKEHVIEALGNATAAMREKLGETLGKIQTTEVRQEDLSTNSLEALQAYRLGEREYGVSGNSSRALPHYLQATELDPNFAMAFRAVSQMSQKIGSYEQARQYDEKAYALLDHVHSERERLTILQRHYMSIGEARKTIETEELLARTYPRDPFFHSDLANAYCAERQFEKAAVEAEAAIKEGPHILQGYTAAYCAYLNLGRREDARAIIDKAFAQGLDAYDLHRARYTLADGGPVTLPGPKDEAALEKERQWFARHPQ